MFAVFRHALPGALAAFFCLFPLSVSGASFGPSTNSPPAPVFLTEPTLVANPNEAVPLAAILRFRASEPVTTLVRLNDGERTRTLTFGPHTDPSAGLPLLGFRPGRTSRVEVSIVAGGRQTDAPQSLSFDAPALPGPGLEMPSLTATLAEPGATEPGVRFISVRRRAPGRQAWQTPAQRRFTTGYGLILGVDESGQIVWSYRSPVRIAGIDALPNGHILMQTQDQKTKEIDLLGNVVREWYAENRPQGAAPEAIPVQGVQTVHHNPFFTPWGTFISMSANAREIPDYFTSVTDPDAPRKTQTVMGDRIIEYDETGRILWDWDTFDYLDTNRVHYHLLQPYWAVRGFPDHLDWTHANGVTFDAERRTLIVSLKHQDALIGIDYDTKEIKWILGAPEGWSAELAAKVLTPVGLLRWPYSMHHPHMTERGTLVYYDNGMFQARPFDGRTPTPFHLGFSRGVEVRIDEEAMTVTELWTSERERTPDSCNNWAMGETQQLPRTGNLMLVRAFCPPQRPEISDFDEYDLSRRFVDDLAIYGRVDEYVPTSPTRRVWSVALGDPNEILQWEIYGGFFEPTLYWNEAAEVEGPVRR